MEFKEFVGRKNGLGDTYRRIDAPNPDPTAHAAGDPRDGPIAAESAGGDSGGSGGMPSLYQKLEAEREARELREKIRRELEKREGERAVNERQNGETAIFEQQRASESELQHLVAGWAVVHTPTGWQRGRLRQLDDVETSLFPVPVDSGDRAGRLDRVKRRLEWGDSEPTPTPPLTTDGSWQPDRDAAAPADGGDGDE